MNFPVQDYPYAACFASASIVLSPKGDMGISASLLRSIFSFNLRLRAGLRPLRSKAPQVIVSSPGFSLWLKPAPRGGMGISALLLRSNLSFNLRQSRRASPVAYGGAKISR